jgi:hypothetical protein
VLVPYVPFKSPRLGKISYGIILAYYLNHDTVVSGMSKLVCDHNITHAVVIGIESHYK